MKNLEVHASVAVKPRDIVMLREQGKVTIDILQVRASLVSFLPFLCVIMQIMCL
jgi:hypothetical protein